MLDGKQTGHRDRDALFEMFGDKTTALQARELDVYGNVYGTALCQQANQNILIVHHGGTEARICEKFDIPATKDVCD